MVGVVVRKASTAFVHAREVHYPVARKVAGDLHVTDEGVGGGNLYWSVPRRAVIRGVGDAEGTAVTPGNIHAPIEWGCRVVVGPARFAIVAGAIVDAKMGPASSIRGSSGLVSAEALTAAALVQPQGEPSPSWLVVQCNRVPNGPAKGALAVSGGDACERRAAIGGDRCAGDVNRVGIAASRIVVSHQNLIGIIGISRGKGLRLRNVGRSLGAGDQVHIRTAVRQRD
jgi:hypothetical protein